ncbi:MAG: 4'-phosphopantetheinyl transferase superfamily protein [Archangiaceae bacterium]|nr:4'-phosphopantetheinyl transferase superfamily protein [Archangiaceae bacterium]
MAFTRRFVERLAHGTAVALDLPAHEQVDARVLERVSPEEQALARGFAVRRMVTFVGGRLALREALQGIGAPLQPVLHDERGAPVLARGFEGSISHKDELAVALAAPADGVSKIGVDVEELRAPKNDITSHIVTPREAALLGTLGADERLWQLMARFSLKEALYKALDPFVRRYVGFHEVEVDLLPAGATKVTLMLKNGEGPFDAELLWHRYGDWVLSTAKVRPAESA